MGGEGLRAAKKVKVYVSDPLVHQEVRYQRRIMTLSVVLSAISTVAVSIY